MKRTYYNIRTVKADSWDDAVEQISRGNFIETDKLSDVVITKQKISKDTVKSEKK